MKRPTECRASRYVVRCDVRPGPIKAGSYSVFDTHHEYVEVSGLSRVQGVPPLR